MFFIVIISNTKAQYSLSFSVGLSNNYLQTNISNQSNTTINYKLGYFSSLSFLSKINNRFLFNTDLSILQKNYSINRTGIYAAIYQNHTNNYIQLPISMNYSVFHRKKIELLAQGGGYIAYWLSGKIKGNIPDIFSVKDSINSSGQNIETFSLTNYSQKYQFNNQIDNRIEFGLIVGLNVIWQLKSSKKINFKFLYFNSLINQQKKYSINEIPRYNQTFVLSMGYLFNTSDIFHKKS